MKYRKYLYLGLLVAFAALAAPKSPTNIQSTGTGTTAVCFPYNQIYLVQCSAAAYMLWGSSAAVASKTRGNASFGVPLAANEKAVTRSGGDDNSRCVSIISDSGTVDCTFWKEDP